MLFMCFSEAALKGDAVPCCAEGKAQQGLLRWHMFVPCFPASLLPGKQGSRAQE